MNEVPLAEAVDTTIAAGIVADVVTEAGRDPLVAAVITTAVGGAAAMVTIMAEWIRPMMTAAGVAAKDEEAAVAVGLTNGKPFRYSSLFFQGPG